jgi:hypothetical protein
MKSSIWKFPLETEDEQIINVPVGAEFLSVQVQHGQPCIWAKVNPQENVIVRAKVVIIGTGHPANASDNMQFIGTYQLHDGNFVGHVFVGGV